MKNYMILWGCLFTLCWASCEGEDELDQIDVLEQESREIKNFLNEQVTGSVQGVPFYTINGLLIDSIYIFHHDPSGVCAQENGFVLLDYTLQNLAGGYLDSTDPDQLLDSARLAVYALGGPIYYALDTSRRFDYVAAALKFISEGTQGELLIPSKLGAQDGVSLRYLLNVRRVIPDIKVYERELIEQYLRSIPNSVGEPLTNYQGDTVVYTVLTKRGNGDRAIQVGDRITLSHKCAILDEVHLEQGVLRGVETWDSVSMEHSLSHRYALKAYMQALTHLKAGDEAEIILPFSVAYGHSNVKHALTGQVLIPAYSTLIFRVAVHSVAAPQTVGSSEES